MSVLFTAEQLTKLDKKRDWRSQAFRLFQQKMSDPVHRFPCIPATQGFALGHFRYGFCNDISELVNLLHDYGRGESSFGKYTSLIIFFPHKKNSVRSYEKFFWQLIHDVIQSDSHPWPENIPDDPLHHMWEFHFQEQGYFVYCATPAHKKRHSRQFPCFTLAFTPRWVLENFHKQPHAQSLQQRIRARLETYDELPPHPELNLYGKTDNREAKQYFLRDDQSSISGCPFAEMKEKTTEDSD